MTGTQLTLKTMFVIKNSDGTYRDRLGRKTTHTALAKLYGRSCDAKNSSAWGSAVYNDKAAAVVPVSVTVVDHAAI